MKRMTVAVLVMTMVLAGTAWAQQDEHRQHHPEQEADQEPGMMQDGGMMMGMMGTPDVASWDGNIYVLSGMKLEKFDSSLNSVETVEFEHAPGMMEDAEMGRRGMMRQQRGELRMGPEGRMMQRGPADERDGMMDEDMMQRMHQMHRMRAMSNTAISADSQGVYVLRGMTLTVYDHDLNEVRSGEVMEMHEDGAMCPMCRRMMERMRQDGGMMGGMREGRMQRGMMMGQQWGEMEERSVAGGMVHLSPPAQPRVGDIPFRVHVLGADHQTDTSASVSGFIYPQGQPERGKAVDFRAGPGGHMMGSVNLQTPGEYELAVRVNRPGHESTVVYYDVTVER